MSARSLLISTTCLLGLALAATACNPDPGGSEPWTSPPAARAESAPEPWTPSEEWLMLWELDQEVSDLRDRSLEEEDRDRQLELYDEYKAAEQELENYFIENPSADAPCDTKIRYAQPQQWCTPQDLDREQSFQVL